MQRTARSQSSLPASYIHSVSKRFIYHTEAYFSTKLLIPTFDYLLPSLHPLQSYSIQTMVFHPMIKLLHQDSRPLRNILLEAALYAYIGPYFTYNMRFLIPKPLLPAMLRSMLIGALRSMTAGFLFIKYSNLSIAYKSQVNRCIQGALKGTIIGIMRLLTRGYLNPHNQYYIFALIRELFMPFIRKVKVID